MHDWVAEEREVNLIREATLPKAEFLDVKWKLIRKEQDWFSSRLLGENISPQWIPLEFDFHKVKFIGLNSSCRGWVTCSKKWFVLVILCGLKTLIFHMNKWWKIVLVSYLFFEKCVIDLSYFLFWLHIFLDIKILAILLFSNS